MPSQRQQRVSELLREEISLIMLRDMHDPHLQSLTVTDVEVSPDLRHAQIYVSTLGDETERRKVLAALTGRAVGFVRGQLARRLDLRRIPELHFRLDDSPRRAQHIEMLLYQIAHEPTAADDSVDTVEPIDGPLPATPECGREDQETNDE